MSNREKLMRQNRDFLTCCPAVTVLGMLGSVVTGAEGG